MRRTRHQAVRLRLALTAVQEGRLDQQAHAARALWNLLHELFTLSGARRPSWSYLDSEIRWARANVDWLNVLPAQAAQAVLKTYRQAWVNCWERRSMAPKFKPRCRVAPAVDIPQGRDLLVARVHRRWGMANVPKVGRVRFRWSRDLGGVARGGPEGAITGARLVKDALGWHIVFRVKQSVPVVATNDAAGSHVGIDRGVALPLALSDGKAYTHGAWLTRKERERLSLAERSAAHKERYQRPGQQRSRRLRTVYAEIKNLRARAKRRVLDWQHKVTSIISGHYAVVSVEALNVVSMIKSAKGTIESPGVHVAQKSGLNRAIASEAWGRTVELLMYKVADRGGLLIQVPAQGTSLRCSECGAVEAGSRESQARFTCRNPECGWTANADFNASRNIDQAGLALASVAGRAVVRQT
ncbi:RNA-guided endonuclease InsQ/TnpB family protein [Streptomyces sp. NPDC059409]|uniref:RNA-guided endonuclease InsQ/TnpB family protein n=1 Tax=Streptomyces sp. NPDC059409 TaxID=3346824 RepID=UPI0036CD4C68